MTTKELLEPRFLVIADYPGSEQTNQVGKIYQEDECSARWLNEMSHYPHLFRKLSWWEHREESEMPPYVKYRFMSDSKVKILKVDAHFSNSINGYNAMGLYANDDYFSYSKTMPATEEEYNAIKDEDKNVSP